MESTSSINFLFTQTQKIGADFARFILMWLAKFGQNNVLGTRCK